MAGLLRGTAPTLEMGTFESLEGVQLTKSHLLIKF
jgi:hypothetical protein